MELQRIYDADTEARILGTFLTDERSHEWIPRLGVDDFYNGKHRHIFTAIRSLYMSKHPVDLVTVKGRLRDAAKLDDVTWPYLCDVANNYEPTEAAIIYHVERLKEKAQGRVLQKLGLSTLEKLESGVNPGDILNEIREVAGKYDDVVDLDVIEDPLEQFWKDLEFKRENKGKLPGVPTGFPDLDVHTTGLHGSTMTILGGRPAMGKTTAALNFHRQLSQAPYRLPTWIISLEMPAKQLWRRFFAAHTGINLRKLQMGELTGEEWYKLEEAKAELAQWPLTITESEFTPGAIERSYNAMAVKPVLVTIDHILIMNSDRETNNRLELITNISKDTKQLAKRIDRPVLALCQLSRAVESQKDKRPGLKDLRECGSLEQDADNVWFVYRDEYYNPEDSTKRGEAEIIIAKNRDGPLASINLLCDLSVAKFKNAPGCTSPPLLWMHQTEQKEIVMPEEKPDYEVQEKDGALIYTVDGKFRHRLPSPERLKEIVLEERAKGKTLEEMRDNLAVVEDNARTNGDTCKHAWALEYLKRLDTILSEIYSAESGTIAVPQTNMLDVFNADPAPNMFDVFQ